MNNRKLITNLAMSYLGTPYIWGGNKPDGFDCSGFVLYIMRQVYDHKLPDMTADRLMGLMDKYPDWAMRLKEEKRLPLDCDGSLVFYGYEGRATHVMMTISRTHCIGAVNGNSQITTVEEAHSRNASVQVRRIDYRDDMLAIFEPRI